MEKSLNAIIVIGLSDRQKVSDKLGELIPFQVKIVSRLDEITEVDWERFKNVIVVEDIVKTKSFLTELEVFQDVYNKDMFYLGSDRIWINSMGVLAKTFQVDILDISYDMLESIIYDDNIKLKEYISLTAPKIEEMAKDILLNKSKGDDDKTLLAEEYLASRELIEELESRVEELEEDIKLSNDNSLLYQDESSRYQRAYSVLYEKVSALNRFTTQINAMTVQDVYTKIDANRFPNRPFVLYLKEWQELLFFEDFILTLKDAFTIQKRLSTQVIRLMDSTDSKRILTVPKAYDRVGTDFTIADVYTSELIVRMGEYEKLLELLLSNNNGMIDVLIIVDQKAHSDTVLTGNVVYMNMCRDEKNLRPFGLSKNNTIVNNSNKSKFGLNYVEEVKSTKNKEDKFLLLANQEIIKNILDLYRSNI